MDNPADNTAKPAPGDNASLPEEKKIEEVKTELPKTEPMTPPAFPSVPEPPETPEPPKPPAPPVSPGSTPSLQPSQPSGAGPGGIVTAAPPRRRSPMKSILIAVIIFLTAASAGLGYYYLQKAGLPFDIGKKATVYCPAPGGGLGQACESFNKCNAQGGCDPACCVSENDCLRGQVCDIPNGNCNSGKSCNDQGGGTHKACRDNQCVYVPGAGADECTSHSQCQTTSPPPGDIDSGYCAGKSGIVCENLGNNEGKAIGWNCTGEPKLLRCQNNHQSFNNVVHCQGIFQYNENPEYPHERVVQHGERFECTVTPRGTCDFAQADVVLDGVGKCWGIIRDCSNCGGPTSIPSPTPIVTSTPSPTPPVTACECTRIEISGASGVDEEGQPVWQVGDQLKISVYFSGSPDDVAVRILKDGLKVADKIHSVISGGAVGSSPWSVVYGISESGDYEIVAFVKKNGVWK